jgi:phosphatidylserine/phosphatidylglycerophosphate/cardiolipin synthase-like enzyme
MKLKRILSLLSIVAITSILITGCGAKKTITASKQDNNIEYYFSKDNGKPDQELIKVIKGAKSNLDIAIYSITKQTIADAILNAKNSGVKVRLITDRQESKTKAEAKELAELKAAGIPIKINTHPGLMHMKVTIADKSIVTTGSYDYTDAATKDNDEVLVILHDTKAAQKFESEFDKMWDDTKNYKVY